MRFGCGIYPYYDQTGLAGIDTNLGSGEQKRPQDTINDTLDSEKNTSGSQSWYAYPLISTSPLHITQIYAGPRRLLKLRPRSLKAREVHPPPLLSPSSLPRPAKLGTQSHTIHNHPSSPLIANPRLTGLVRPLYPALPNTPAQKSKNKNTNSQLSLYI